MKERIWKKLRLQDVLTILLGKLERRMRKSDKR